MIALVQPPKPPRFTFIYDALIIVGFALIVGVLMFAGLKWLDG